MKGNLLLGTARGKLGDVVAKVVHGEQILSKHQPNVHNPRTPLQVEQREIFGRATQGLKKMRDLFDEVGLISVYNKKHGSSTNIRDVFMPLSIASQRAQILRSKEFVESSFPTTIKTRIGNNIMFSLGHHFNNPEPGIFGLLIMGNDGYSVTGPQGPRDFIFGSNVPLSGKLYIFAASTCDIACGDACVSDAVNVVRAELDFDEVPQDECPEQLGEQIYKQPGFIGVEPDDNLLEVGFGWPFVYKVNESQGFGSEPLPGAVYAKGVMGPGSELYSSGFFIAYDSRGTFVSAGRLDSRELK